MALLKLTCKDISAYVNSVVVSSFLVVLIHLDLILASYTLIFLDVLHMNFPGSRNKTPATCSSHLCVVGLFFGSAIVMYMAPKSRHPEEQQKVLFLFYSFFNPMLNPLIYSLRNAEVKGALRRVISNI